MKRFVLEVCVFALVVIATAFCLHQLYPPSELAQKIQSLDDQLDIVNFGSSHGNNFIYVGTHHKGAALNKEGNTLYYDLQNLIYLHSHDRLTDNAIVMFPVSYFSFGMDENREDRLPDDSFVNDFYYYLPPHQIYNYSESKQRFLTIYRIQQNFQNLLSGNQRQIEEAPQNAEQLNEHALKRAEHHRDFVNEAAKSANLGYLRTAIEYCHDHGYRPVLVCTPFYRRYTEEMNADGWLFSNYYAPIGQLVRDTGVKFLDYSSDPRFTNDPTLFINSDHLNATGRLRFSQIILKDLK